MVTSFIVLCLIGLGVSRMVKHFKANPGQALQAASWVGKIFRK